MSTIHSFIHTSVKVSCDRINLPSQCARMKIIQKHPNNYETSLLIKINMKMGGVNHTLTSRTPVGKGPPVDEGLFQDPPQSISWLFDVPTMVMVSGCIADVCDTVRWCYVAL